MNVFLHAILSIAVIVFFAYRFVKSHQVYQLVLVLWMISTFGVYISAIPRMPLSIVEFVFFVVFLISYFCSRPKRAAEQKYYESLQKQLEDSEQDQIQKSQQKQEQ